MKATLFFLMSALIAVNGRAQETASISFGETLHTLTTLSESGEGFISISTEEKISAGGYTDAQKASVMLLGASACLLSTYDQSYVAWFGAYPTLQAAKARVNTLTTQVLAALGESYKSGDDYVEPKKGTFMRFFYYETNMNRSSSAVAIELAFFQGKYQIRLSIPSKAPAVYLRTRYYKVQPNAEHEAFKKGFNQLQNGIQNNFAEMRGELLSEELVSGKIYALKMGLPGMQCTTTVDGAIETYNIAPARPSHITHKKVTTLFILEGQAGYQIGIRIRDLTD